MKRVPISMIFSLSALSLGAQEISYTPISIPDSEERKVLLLFTKGYQAISPETETLVGDSEKSRARAKMFLFETLDRITGDPLKESVPIKDKATGKPLTPEEIESIIEAFVDQGQKSKPLNLIHDPDLSKSVKFGKPGDSRRVSRVGFDHSKQWAVIEARSGGPIIGSFSSAILRLENGVWRFVFSYASHAL